MGCENFIKQKGIKNITQKLIIKCLKIFNFINVL